MQIQNANKYMRRVYESQQSVCSVCEDCDHGIVQAVNTLLQTEDYLVEKLQEKWAVIVLLYHEFLQGIFKQEMFARKRGTGLKRVSTPAQDRILKRLCLSDR